MTLLDRTTWHADEDDELDAVLGYPCPHRGLRKWEHTGSGVPGDFELFSQVVQKVDPTRPAKVLRPKIGVRVVVGDDVPRPGSLERAPGGLPAGDDVDLPEESTETGAPSAALLLGAVRDLQSWLSLTQDQVCEYVGVSRSTVMAWRRNPAIHPRHPRLPLLLHLWAAVGGAREEFGAERTARLVHQRGRLTDGDQGPDVLAEVLLDAVENASVRALEESSYCAASAPDMTAGEIEAGEAELSDALTRAVERSSE